MTSASEFLSAVLPVPEQSESIEIRAKNACTGEIVQEFAPSVDRAVAKTSELREKHDIWFGPCLREGAKGDADHSTRVGSVWSDADYKCFDDGEAGAKAALLRFPLEPSILVASGHGFHPYWLLQEPTDREDNRRVRSILRGIRVALSTQATRPLDAVHDICRVMRLPDTLNLKQSPAIPVRVLTFNDARRYDFSDFIEAGLWEDEPEPSGSREYSEDSFTGDPEEALRRAIRGGLPAWAIGALEEPTAHTRRSLSELDFSIMCELVRRLSPAEAEAVWIYSELGAAEHTAGTAKTHDRADYRRKTIERALTAVRDDKAESAPGVTHGGLVFRTAKDIASSAPANVPWIVQGFVAQGALTEVDAQVKAGKTTLLLACCRAVIDGKPFPGQPTKQSGVIYLTEQPDTSFRSSLARAGLLNEEHLTVLSFHQTSGMPFADVISAARAEAKRRGASVLIVDTLGQFAGLQGDAENNAGDALQAIAPLQQAAAIDNLAVIPVRHERKSGGEVGASARGSSAYAGTSDVILAVRRTAERDSNRRTLHALSRFDETPSTLVIELDGAEYRALGNAVAVAFDDARDAVLATLTAAEDSAKTFDSILAEIEGGSVKRSTAQSALKTLVDEGQVQRIGAGKKGSPYRYWRTEDDA
jgi:AAA domain